MSLTWAMNYGTKLQEIHNQNTFVIQGAIGYNYTGAMLGGMEVGATNVLLCGTSVPQGYKVKGVTGTSNRKPNVFLTVTNKKTGKSSVKWLTTYNPKSTKVTVSEARLVKLSDTRFAVLYSTTEKKKETLHYVVVDDTGKKLTSKTYKNMVFNGITQPLLTSSGILWSDISYDRNYKTTVKTFRIPAIF